MDFQRKAGISFWEIMKEIAGGMCNMPCCFKQLREGGATRDATQTLCITATNDDVTCVTEMLRNGEKHVMQHCILKQCTDVPTDITNMGVHLVKR